MKFHPSHRLLLATVLLFVLVVPVLADPLCLKFELRRIVTPHEKGKPEDKTETLQVVLGDTFLEIEHGDQHMVYDFANRVTHQLEGKTYYRSSLYAEIGFRSAEAQNRWFLGDALREAKVPEAADAMGDVVMVEHLFSVDDGKTEAGIDKAEKSGAITYKIKGKLLAEASASGKALSAEQSKSYTRFLRYFCAGHPDILKDIEARALIPDDLRVDLDAMVASRSYRMHLLEAVDCKAEQPDFSALRPTPPKDELGPLLELGRALKTEQVAATRDAVLARAQSAFDKGQALEAVLALLEAHLIGGGATPPLLASGREVFQADPDCRILFEAMNVSEQHPDMAEKAARSLAGKAPNSAHVLKIFEAGWLLPQGKIEPARQLYLEALKTNPAIIGAWKDLGDIYYNRYETHSAWLCWDLARALAPRHEMVQAVSEFERALSTEYPEYF